MELNVFPNSPSEVDTVNVNGIFINILQVH